MAEFTLVQVRYFVAAAELGGMTAAARELVVAQSAISSAVANLEKDLGVQLFLRHHARGLSLTPAGARFLAEAREFLAHAGRLAESAHELGAGLTGELTVGCFVTLAPFYVPGLLAAFAGKHPAVRVSVAEGELAGLQQALLVGGCELALMYAIEPAAELEVEPLARVEPYAVLPPGHPLADAGDRTSLEALAGEPMILLDLPHSRDYFRSLFTQSGVEPRIRFRTTSYETVRSMVAAGHGYSILNQRPSTDHTYGGGRVAAVPLDDELPALDLVLARRKDARPTARASAFAEVCRNYIREADSIERKDLLDG
ncbi:MAG: hypothetical protein QOE54_4141 [Streptosporangiaceae bacterium]|jgi:DNA-binding transcriptional LysR family regulator|nr:transcriptional regulator, LysR family [Streptosporangiaceae bacterium]MDX6431775.1 hypothetical protein [Streptosporangiaceae bacterium]